MITRERAGTISVCRVVDLIASKRCTKETGNWLHALFNKLKFYYNNYIDIAGVVNSNIGTAERDKIKDDTPLLYLLTGVKEFEFILFAMNFISISFM